MKLEIYSALVGLFCTIVSSTVTFFLTRRKYNTEVDSQQIKNLNEAFDTYKKMAQESLESQKVLMKTTIDQQNKTIENLNKKIEDLERENVTLKKQIADLQLQLIELFGENINRKK